MLDSKWKLYRDGKPPIEIKAREFKKYIVDEWLCNEISSLMALIWWTGTYSKRKIHWKSWRDLQNSKAQGDLGFKNPRLFNLAMLPKARLEVINLWGDLIEFAPICKEPNEDILVWHYSKDGQYINISGYKRAITLEDEGW